MSTYAWMEPAASMGTRPSTSASNRTSPSEISAAKRRMAFPKSDIRVHLQDHSESTVYTTGSSLVGNVTITTKREVRFDTIQIVLLGQARTTSDGMNAPQEVTHTFLKMLMPVSESLYPVPRVLEPGTTYTIPFNFVVPSQLTINACNHARLSSQLQDHHTLLPPSVGGWKRDDLAPKMAQVDYTIKARVMREDSAGRKTRIMEATQPIQVLPATPEDPPLNITEQDSLYRMSKTKTLRKNLLATKLGRLTATTAQPNPAVLSADGRRVMSHPLAHITLTFTPESARTLPPTITGATAKLTAHTFFSSATIADFPNLNGWHTAPYTPARRGHYSTSITLPPATLNQQPAWTPVPPHHLTRRDSGYGGSSASDSEHPHQPHQQHHRKSKSKSSSNNTPSSAHAPVAHTTTVSVPLVLPTDKKTLLPTFHSCITSRVYAVQLTLQLGAGGGAQTLSVTVPLQIAVEGFAPLHLHESMTGMSLMDGYVDGGLPSFEEVAVDEFLRPRVLRVPEEEFLERGSEWMVPRVGHGEEEEDGVAAQDVGDGLPGYGELGYGVRA